MKKLGITLEDGSHMMASVTDKHYEDAMAYASKHPGMTLDTALLEVYSKKKQKEE